jgi:hypothetical protein
VGSSEFEQLAVRYNRGKFTVEEEVGL